MYLQFGAQILDLNVAGVFFESFDGDHGDAFMTFKRNIYNLLFYILYMVNTYSNFILNDNSIILTVTKRIKKSTVHITSSYPCSF